MKTTALSLVTLLASLSWLYGEPAPPSDPPENKASQIQLPKIQLSKTPLASAIQILTVFSKQRDPEKTGVKIVLADPKKRGTIVNLDIPSMNVADAARKLAEAAKLDIRFEAERIVLGP